MDIGFACEEIQRLLTASKTPKEQYKEVPNDTGMKPAVIVIAGPTAVGKSEFAMKLAQLLSGEIVSADSMQVYRGMDIGTAKPSIRDREKVLHHLIDIRDVTDPLNVALFAEHANESIASCIARGKVPIVVGGSGFYIQAIMQGPPPGPSADPFIRAHLESEVERLGTEYLYQELLKQDPEYAKTISCGDRQKIVRAFEIMILTQCKVSQLRWAKGENCKYRFCPFFFHRQREDLYKRINLRCEEMLSMGFLHEVTNMVDNGLLENPSAMQAIGYRQALDFLKTARRVEDYEFFLAEFKKASRHYAKRQFTWFRKQNDFLWLDLGVYTTQQLIDLIFEEYFGRI